MAKYIKLEPIKTYATEDNAHKAVDKFYADDDSLSYIIMRTDEGRFYPLFIGNRAIEKGVFFNFGVVN